MEETKGSEDTTESDKTVEAAESGEFSYHGSHIMVFVFLLQVFLILTPVSLRKRRFGSVKHVESEGEWKSLLKEASSLKCSLFVEFTAPFCKPCKKIAPIFSTLATETSGMFALVDVEELQDLAVELGVGALPAFHVYKNSKFVESMMGDDESRLRAFVAKHA
jgi:thioredoxin 1